MYTFSHLLKPEAFLTKNKLPIKSKLYFTAKKLNYQYIIQPLKVSKSSILLKSATMFTLLSTILTLLVTKDNY